MWFPRFESPYNENLSPKITYALGRVIINHNALAALHTGIYQASTKDEFTSSLLIRSRLQTQSKHWLSDTPAVVTVAPNAGVGGRKKR